MSTSICDYDLTCDQLATVEVRTINEVCYACDDHKDIARADAERHYDQHPLVVVTVTPINQRGRAFASREAVPD